MFLRQYIKYEHLIIIMIIIMIILIIIIIIIKSWFVIPDLLLPYFNRKLGEARFSEYLIQDSSLG